jgi:hypothetical protein
MKKSLLKVSVLLLLASMIFITACSSPTASYPTIDELENLKISSDTGVIILTWDPVKDAARYVINRKESYEGKNADGDDEEINVPYVKIGTTPATGNNLRYLDIISDSNILVDLHSYTYQVVADSGSTLTNVGSTAATIDYEPKAGTFPAKGTDLAVTITAPTITVDEVYGLATLTWTGSTNPAVTYGFRNSTNITWTSTSGTSAVSQTITGKGFADAQIYARFGTGAGNTYYPASTEVYVEPVPYNVKALDYLRASTPSATRIAYTNQVVITYDKVPGATTYILQKAKNNDAGAAWEDVSAAAIDTGSAYSVTDTVDEAAWFYRLFVRSANGISPVSTTSPTISA